VLFRARGTSLLCLCCSHHHQRGGRAALLSGGHTPPSGMPINSPHGSASGGNDNSSGASLPRSLLGPGSLGVTTAERPDPTTAECCTRLPVCHSCARRGGSFGCSVNLPLGSRPVDPHSTTVWCGNLLHSSPQPHTAEVLCLPLITRWSTRYYNQDLRRETLQPGVAPAGAARSPMPSLHHDALLVWVCRPPQRGWTVRDKHSTDLGTIHFRSRTLRQVSCYTFLSGFQPSWPPSCYPEQATSFVGSEYEPALRICKSTLGAPRIASTAYQSWPT